ncbi:PaaI family thioesterase [Deinococcus sp.]|uniref:PaaI family thioesterase n=1 Tax=Deinococcus sp. TaxID=47478 RepID=UPI003CC583A4
MTASIFQLSPSDIGALSPAELAARLSPRPGTLGEHLGVTLLEASRERVVASMPVEGNRQPAGRLHGGASAALAEELASIGSWLNLDASKQVPVGVDLNITHVRGALAGLVRGEAELSYRGRRVLVWTVNIRGEDGKLTSTARCTCSVIEL